MLISLCITPIGTLHSHFSRKLSMREWMCHQATSANLQSLHFDAPFGTETTRMRWYYWRPFGQLRAEGDHQILECTIQHSDHNYHSQQSMKFGWVNGLHSFQLPITMDPHHHLCRWCLFQLAYWKQIQLLVCSLWGRCWRFHCSNHTSKFGWEGVISLLLYQDLGLDW